MNPDINTPVHAVAIPMIVLFGAYAMYATYREKKLEEKKKRDVAYFIAAHNSQSLSRVIFTFISSSLGAWVTFAPAGYALYAGYVGLISYAVAAGIPLLIPAYIGPIIQRYSNAISLNDFVLKRYGIFAQYFVTLLCLYSMAIGMIAEYTAVGDLFEKIVGGNRIFIVVLIGIITCIYTAYGGLSVSVKTDQIQVIFILIMGFIFTIYIASEFRLDTSVPLSPDLDANEYGYASIAAMPLALSGSVVYSEQFWQKAWVARKESDLKLSSWIAAVIVTIYVFLFGFFGFLASWAGKEIIDYNLSVFAIFDDYKPTWILVILCILTIAMNESAIDSYQIGITSSISSCFFKNLPLWVTQLSVVLLNIPIMIVSLENYNIISLFLSANLVTAAASFPLLFGLIKRIENYYDSVNLFLGSILSLFFTSIWAADKTNDVHDGMRLIFYECYCWESFIIAVFTSIGVSLGISLIRYVIDKILIKFGVNIKRGKKVGIEITNNAKEEEFKVVNSENDEKIFETEKEPEKEINDKENEEEIIKADIHTTPQKLINKED